MKILIEYTFDFVKRNRKSSLAIMTAIMISATILSSLFGFMYTMYRDELKLIILTKGNWHAELYDNTSGDKLKYVTGHPNVETVMIKGTWKCAKIDDPRRPYLILRDLTENYWRDMPEHFLILEGRIPSSIQEIALSKQYFEHHPELKIGDTITLPIGNRTIGEEALEPRSILQKEELFVSKGEQTYTVVGKLDVTTNSVIPGYLAYGYMSENSIEPQDQLTVYIKFKNPRSTYIDIEQIAQSVGFKKNEFGNYKVEANRSLLMKYFIFSPKQKATMQLVQLSIPLMALIIGIIVMFLFIYLIKNAFAMSANDRFRQLGMLQSIGASPKQIRHSIVFEGLLLSVIPIPAGIIMGWLLNLSLITYINSIPNARQIPVVPAFDLIAVLPALCFSLLTVWFSAMLPAKKLAKFSIIDIIRQGSNDSLKKLKKNRVIFKLFGIEGEMARNALTIRKKSYRVAVISLTLSFLLFSSFLMLNAVSVTTNQIIYSERPYESERDLMLRTLDGNSIEPEAQKQLRELAGVKSILFVSDIPVSTWITPDMESKEIISIGGLSRISSLGKYAVYEENGKYRIYSNLIALDDNSFHDYCSKLGIDPEPYYDTKQMKTIVVNSIKDVFHSNPRKEVFIPFLNIDPGDQMTYSEKLYLDDTGTYSFKLQVGYITNQLPALGERYPGFQLTQILPISVYLHIVDQFEKERASSAKKTYIPIVTDKKETLSLLAANVTNVCERWYGSGDYSIMNIEEEKKLQNSSKKLLQSIMICIASFLALIGFVNVFTTVSGNLRHRQKDFAMLQSVGLSLKGMRKMLFLEGFLLGIFPILISMPIALVITGIFLKINYLYFYEYIPFLPFLPIAAYALLIILIITIAYAIGIRRLSRISIVEAIKDETM